MKVIDANVKELNPYRRYLCAQLRAEGLALEAALEERINNITTATDEHRKQTDRAIRFGRLKARAYRMYAIETPYY